jgi:hypothetical protein
VFFGNSKNKEFAMRVPDPSLIHEAIVLMQSKSKIDDDIAKQEIEDRIKTLCEAFAKELMDARK